MSISQLPLGYCTNVHPGRSAAQVEAGLDRYTLPVRAALGRPLAAGLWLAQPVVRELLGAPDGVARFADGLARRNLSCHTLNAFPFGDFHSDRVKEKVYLPDWASSQRLDYTLQCATVLCALLSEGGEGSISTLPLGFKGHEHAPDFMDRAIDRLIECARGLNGLRERLGKIIRLAIEPEPMCVLETTAEAIRFFQRLHERADPSGALEFVRTHLGLCYDVCHQAVEFEDVSASIRQIDQAGIRINKVHISCALQLNDPANNAVGRAALLRYVESRYLHQTIARLPDGRIIRATDLTQDLVNHPSLDFRTAPAWRVHFHVPVDAQRLGPLGTTRDDLKRALSAVASLDYAPHLEVETYTWDVMPGEAPGDLAAGLMREMVSANEMVEEATA
ncbi:MAG TPA: metabolite traffic protein EboE [Tepidisphaeraceae bacterium]|nr:metabolite traffic protein EboE [Tepidisphaeraceae bacterium]